MTCNCTRTLSVLHRHKSHPIRERHRRNVPVLSRTFSSSIKSKTFAAKHIKTNSNVEQNTSRVKIKKNYQTKKIIFSSELNKR